MTEQKHTPGLLMVGMRQGRYEAIPANEQESNALMKLDRLKFDAMSVGANGSQVALIPLDESNPANARRIMACWNACEGIPTEQLEREAYRIHNTPYIAETDEQGNITVRPHPDHTALLRQAYEALNALTEDYVGSGDVGFWNPEEQEIIINSRKTLAAIREALGKDKDDD